MIYSVRIFFMGRHSDYAIFDIFNEINHGKKIEKICRKLIDYFFYF